MQVNHRLMRLTFPDIVDSPETGPARQHWARDLGDSMTVFVAQEIESEDDDNNRYWVHSEER